MSFKQQFYLICLVFIVLALAAKFYLLFVATPHWDENYYLNIAVNYQDHSLLTPRMWRIGADANIIAGSGTGYGIYLPILWFQVFGISLISGRILMYLVALLILPVIYYTARLWWGQLAGLVAAVYTVLNPMFYRNFIVRMDAFGELAYALVLLLHIYALRSKRHYLHFFTGVAAVFAAEIHILAVLYLFALAFYHLVDQIQSSIVLRRLHLKSSMIYYMTGALVAGLIYIAVHILPDSAAYFTIVRSCPNCTLPSLEKEMLRLIMFFAYAFTPSTIFIVAVSRLALHNMSQRGHYLLLLAGIVLMTLIISPPAQFEYISHYLPLMALGVGGFFYSFYPKIEELNRRTIFLIPFLLTYMLLSCIVYIVNNVKPAPQIDSVSYIHAHLPHDTTIVAAPNFYVYLIEYRNFMTISDGEGYGIELRGESFASFLEREAPEAIITEPFLYTQNCPESFDALINYIDSHDMVFVLPDLVVSRELANGASPVEASLRHYPKCIEDD